MGVPFHVIHVVMARDGGVIKIFGPDEFAAADELALEMGAIVVDAYEPIPETEEE